MMLSNKPMRFAKVVWIGGGTVQNIMVNKTFGVAQDFVNKNRSNPEYTGGVLKTVSNDLRNENILHAYSCGNLKR